MRPILPLHPLVVDQADVGLVDQRRGLEAVISSLAPHVPVGEPTEFGVHDGRQRVERALVAVAPGAEQGTDVAMKRGHQCSHSRGIVRSPNYKPPVSTRRVRKDLADHEDQK